MKSGAKAIVGSIVVASASVAVFAQTWPQWRGPQRDGQAAVTAPATWDAKPTQVWRVPVGVGHSSPLVADGRVYLLTRQGDQEVASALDLQSGKAIWTQKYAAPYRVNSAAAAHGPGPKSTPVLQGGRLYTLGISGILSAFDAATGTLQWRRSFEKEFKDTSPEYGVAMSPIIDGGLLIAHVGGKDQGALRAFDAQSGQTKWSWTEDGPGYASPIIVDAAGTRQLVTLTQKFVVGISLADGATLWRQPFATAWDQNSATPIAYKDTVIISGENKGTLALRIAKQGTTPTAKAAEKKAPEKKATERKDTDKKPAETWTATKVWENADLSMYMNSPVLRGDLLFGLSHKNKGQLFALDARTGTTRWTSPPRQGENAAIVAAGPLLFVLTDEARLIVADATGDGYKPLRTYEVASSPTWAHPVVLGSRILVKDADSLALLTLGSGSATASRAP